MISLWTSKGNPFNNQYSAQNPHHSARKSLVFKKPTNASSFLETNIDKGINNNLIKPGVLKSFNDSDFIRDSKLANLYSPKWMKSVKLKVVTEKAATNLTNKFPNENVASIRENYDPQVSENVYSTPEWGKNKVQPSKVKSSNPSLSIITHNCSTNDVGENERVMNKVSKLNFPTVKFAGCLCEKHEKPNYDLTSLSSTLNIDPIAEVQSDAVWGKYCKNLSSHDQRKLIFQSKYFSDIESKVDQWYIVPSSWWREWWDFVNVEFDSYFQLIDKYKKSRKTSSVDRLQKIVSSNKKTKNTTESMCDSLFIRNSFNETNEPSVIVNDLFMARSSVGAKLENILKNAAQESKNKRSLNCEEDNDNTFKSCRILSNELYERPTKILNKGIFTFTATRKISYFNLSKLKDLCWVYRFNKDQSSDR